MNEYGNLSSVMAVLGVFAIILLIIIIPIVVVMIVAKWKMFQKAGKKGWESIVPFYSDWVYVEISNLNWWWFFVVIAGNILTFTTSNSDGETVSFSFGSIISLFGLFVCNYNLAKKLHKDTGFAVLMTIFPVIMIPIIAFSSSYSFDNSVELSNNGPFPDNGTSNNTTNQNTTTTNEENNIKYCPHCGEKLEKDAKYCPKCGKEI